MTTNKIRVRDDDVLIGSSSWDNSLGRFQQVHNWCLRSPLVIHVPSILVTEIQQFPEAIEYIKAETKRNKMEPQIHGLSHIDYAKLPIEEVKEHLKICKDWINNNMDYLPTKWYTPWGANAAHLYDAAQEEHLELIDCSNLLKLNGRFGVIQALKEGHDPIRFLLGKEIFMHWWEGGQRLNRVMSAIINGFYQE